MKNDNSSKYVLYGVVGLVLILVLVFVLTLQKNNRELETELVVSSNVVSVVETPEIKQTPKPTRNEIINQLIRTKTGEVYGYKEDHLLEELAEYDPRDAIVWEAILKYWDIANAEGFVNEYTILPIRKPESELSQSTSDTVGGNDEEESPAPPTIEEMLEQRESKDDPLPQDLPQDGSLCIVVLGFQLNPDGSIRQELVNRLTAAYLCAQQYPNAYVLTTGGPTASQEPGATEAEAMADYLVENGIEADRLIVENSSMTTYENAIYSCEILSTQYPEVENIVVVSSDYHIPMGCLLFEAQSLIDTFELEGMTPIHVIGNVGCRTDGRYYFGASSQASQLSSLAY